MKRKLAPLRKRIDEIDHLLLKLIERRVTLVKKIGKTKQEYGIPIYQPQREKKIILRLIQNTSLPAPSVKRLFSTLIDECRKLEFSPRPATESGRTLKSISLVGVGLMGGSLIKDLRIEYPKLKIHSYDPKIRRSKLKYSSLIILASPLDQILNFIKKDLPRLPSGTIVLDLGSTKAQICSLAWKIAPRGVVFIGGHPLAGKAVSGYRNAEAGLYRNRPFVLCLPPGLDAPPDDVKVILAAIGATPVQMSPQAHDQMLALTSHLPQVIASTLAYVICKQTKGRSLLHGPALVDMTRLASSEFRIWKSIFDTNQPELSRAIKNFKNDLLSFEKGNILKMKRIFQEARQFREKHIQT